MKNKRKTLAIALGAGGARGICHIGFLQVLEENDIHVDFIAGCSMGAVIGGAYASGTTLHEMEECVRGVKQSEIVDISFSPLKKLGLLKGSFARQIILKYLHCELAQDTKIPFKSIAVDILSGKLVVLDKGSLIENIHASMAIPGIFQPVKIDDSLYVDGGLLCRVPIATARSFNADVVIAIDAMGETKPVSSVDNLISLVARLYEVIDWDRSCSCGDKADLLVTPIIDGATPYHAKYAIESLEAGRRAGQESLPQILKLLK